jgi:GNAT superfamily N-acetyltransferase
VSIIPYTKRYQKFVSDLILGDWKFNFGRFIQAHRPCRYFKGFIINYYNINAGFGNILIFGNIAWIGNLIITKAFRRIGLGSILLGHIIKFGKQNGVKTFNLISTTIGKSLYQKSGFEPLINYSFYRSQSPGKMLEVSGGICQASKNDFKSIFGIDLIITGEARSDFLKHYLEGTKVYYNGEGRLTGFLIENLGDGLILSIEPTAGLELLNLLTGRTNNRIIIPESNMLAKEFLVTTGYQYYMNAARMRLGESYSWKPQCVFSRGSGYCG